MLREGGQSLPCHLSLQSQGMIGSLHLKPSLCQYLWQSYLCVLMGTLLGIPCAPCCQGAARAVANGKGWGWNCEDQL